jgi:DNA helicase HerA-like ATPase
MPSVAPFPWMPGEHMAVIGDTGTGKTYLMAKAILPLRKYVVVFKTKADDDDDSKWRGYHRIRTAKGIRDERYERFLLDPVYRSQAREGYDLLDRVWRQGGWTIVIDEGWYTEKLGLQPYIERLLTQGRSTHISVVFGQQRPVATSRFVISQTSHLFTFRVEGRDADTIAEATTPRLLPYISERYAERTGDSSHLLTGFDFAYYHRPSRTVGVGNARTLGHLIRAPRLAAEAS